MNKTMLVAPFGGPISIAIAAEARASGWSVVLALPGPPREAAPPEGRGEQADTTALAYNPASFVSISALVLAARNALGEIDAGILISDQDPREADFANGKPGELGSLIDERCSGPLFVARELIRRFEARGSGRLLLIAPEPPRDASPGPASALAAGAFEGLGRGLFALSAGSRWSAFGVYDATNQADRVARFAVGLLDETKASKAGRWLRFTGRTGIFGVI